ncbi:phospholipase D-like domain-containing protein [Ureaplasma ceti]|uniref:phospholipase D-like domain-containing protein n=1 Tax=Ureaplasma ceti TaxID=3119530 RepID=UPI003342B01C
MVFQDLSQYAKSVRGVQTSYNNDFEILKDNQDFYKAVMENIDLAKEHIFIQYYIVDDGFFLNSLVHKLLKKADEGIKIYFMFDRYGCQTKFKPDMVACLAQHKNIEVAKFESDKDIKFRSTNNFRNHRKVMIIDNKLAIYGGSNIADEYLSLKRNHPNWKDLNMIIKGDLVKNMLVDYCMDWDFNSFLPYTCVLGDYVQGPSFLKPLLWVQHRWFLKKHYKTVAAQAIQTRKITKNLVETLNLKKYFEVEEPHVINEVHNEALFMTTGPRYYSGVASETILTAIFNATKSVKIISPYLHPNDEIMAALQAASFRKVKVELILPGSCDDKWFLLNMNRIYYEPLLDAHVSIKEYAGFIHTKAIIIDDEIVITGTFNLDLRSLTSNFESILVIKDTHANEQMKEYWEECSHNATRFTKGDLINNLSLRNSFIKGCLQIIKPLL